MKFIALVYISLTASLFSNEMNISFIALNKGEWDIIVCENDTCQTIQTEQEARTYDYDFENGNVVYIASDKSVRVILNNKEIRILESTTDAYTQPMFINKGKGIMLVKLINGNSTNTKIISMDLEGKTRKTLVYQHSTALESYLNDMQNIYYANVSCVEGCGKIIQEIWHKDIVSGEAEQLTLLNALSHQPIIDSKNEFVYFSSNSKGAYHIWRSSLKDASLKQLTFGDDVTDGFPVLYDNGILFLRRVDMKLRLMHLDSKGNLIKLNMAKAYKKIRNLKAKQ